MASYVSIASFLGQNREEGKESHHIDSDKNIFSYIDLKVNILPRKVLQDY